jgi:peroxiredoxin
MKPTLKTIRYVAAGAAVLAIGVSAVRSIDTRSAAPIVAYTLLDGSKSGIDQLRGKVVLVNFWATSCSTCVQEMPQIVATHAKYQPRGYETVAVAMRHDAPASVVHFAQSRGLPFGIAIDNTGAIAQAFGDVSATPTSVLIDRDGNIVKRFVGVPDFAALHRLIEKLLAQS